MLTLLIALAALTSEASAQGRTIYSNDGRIVGRYTTDSQGTTTLYDANGRVISRATGNRRLARRALAVALARDMAVNCVAPGLVEGTRMAERVPDEMKQRARNQAVLGRTGSAQDIADQVVTFCRAESVMGQVIVVDGGMPVACAKSVLPGARRLCRAQVRRRPIPQALCCAGNGTELPHRPTPVSVRRRPTSVNSVGNLSAEAAPT